MLWALWSLICLPSKLHSLRRRRQEMGAVKNYLIKGRCWGRGASGTGFLVRVSARGQCPVTALELPLWTKLRLAASRRRPLCVLGQFLCCEFGDVPKRHFRDSTCDFMFRPTACYPWAVFPGVL